MTSKKEASGAQRSILTASLPMRLLISLTRKNSKTSTTLFTMKVQLRKTMSALVFAVYLQLGLHPAAQNSSEPAPPPAPVIPSLQLDSQTAADLQAAVARHDYVGAEKMLLAQIAQDSKSPRTAHLLDYIGVIYFQAQDYTNASIAWKKAEAIEPLDPALQFSLAMAFVHMGRPDWAKPILESLALQNPRDALYPYWLGRLFYDGHDYNGAIQNFKHAIELDPGMARAYDNLGLCYYYQNQNQLALANFQRAIDLDRTAGHPSPWPYLNIATAQQFLNQTSKAEANLREALRLDPDFSKAHFQLGTILEDEGRMEEALKEFRQAAQFDPSYPEPHMAMARVLHKLGQESAAREEVQAYLRLHPHSTP